jgi:xanthosine utilization system XapX-like protein
MPANLPPIIQFVGVLGIRDRVGQSIASAAKRIAIPFVFERFNPRTIGRVAESRKLLVHLDELGVRCVTLALPLPRLTSEYTQK